MAARPVPPQPRVPAPCARQTHPQCMHGRAVARRRLAQWGAAAAAAPRAARPRRCWILVQLCDAAHQERDGRVGWCGALCGWKPVLVRRWAGGYCTPVGTQQGEREAGSDGRPAHVLTRGWRAPHANACASAAARSLAPAPVPFWITGDYALRSAFVVQV